MKVLDVKEGSNYEKVEGVVSETGVACQANIAVVDGECQTCSDFMDKHKQRKTSLCCSRQLTNIFKMVTMLRQCVGKFSLSADFLQNIEVLYRYH